MLLSTPSLSADRQLAGTGGFKILLPTLTSVRGFGGEILFADCLGAGCSQANPQRGVEAL